MPRHAAEQASVPPPEPVLDGSAGDVSASLVAHLHQCLHGYSLAQISRLPLGLWLCCRDPSPGSLRTVPGQTQGSEPGSEMLPSLREARPSLCVQVGGHHQLPTATPPHRPRSQRAWAPQTGHPPQSGDFICRKGENLSARVGPLPRPPPGAALPPAGSGREGEAVGPDPEGCNPCPPTARPQTPGRGRGGGERQLGRSFRSPCRC